MSNACFPQDGVAFLAELAANNNKAWFQSQAGRYQTQVQAPAAALQSALQDHLAARFGWACLAKTFRLHRDLRFSPDTPPYNAHLRMAFHPAWEGRQPQLESNPAGLFLSIEPTELIVGCGRFVLPKPDLEAYRRRLLGPEGDHLAKLVATALAQGCRFWEPELKRLPPGFPADYPHPHLARCKSISLWFHQPLPSWLHQPGAVEALGQEFVRFQPLLNWLTREA